MPCDNTSAWSLFSVSLPTSVCVSVVADFAFVIVYLCFCVCIVVCLWHALELGGGGFGTGVGMWRYWNGRMAMYDCARIDKTRFFDIFKIWPPGGARPFVYFFVFTRFGNVPPRFDDFFLFEMNDLHKKNIF